MSADPQFFDQIDDFLTGKLAPDDCAEMEKAILEHADLAQEVGMRRLEFDISESLIAADIRTQFARLQQQSAGATSAAPSTVNVKNRVILAMLLILLIVFLIWLISFFTHRNTVIPAAPLPPPQISPTERIDTPNPGKKEDSVPSGQEQKPSKPMASDFSKRRALAQAAYIRPDFEQVRGAATALDSFDILLDAWHKNDYQTAKNAAAKISITSPLYIKSRYILAHVLFLSRNYGQAAATFGQVADSKMMPYSEEADWYVILALMSQKTVDQTVLGQRMEHILKAPEHTYYKECKSLY